MAVTLFKLPPLFRKPKNVEIPRFLKQFSPDTAGYSKSRFELNVRKNASNKLIIQIFAFLIISTGLFKREPRGQLFPAGDHKTHINRRTKA